MCKLNLKAKLFIVISLVVLVVGMSLFALGFNQTVDYKDSFEVRVTTNQRTGIETVRNETEKFFEDNDINPKDYAYQELGEGKVLIYKFNKEVPTKVGELQEYVQSKLSETLKVTVEINEVVSNKDGDMGWVVLALGIAVVAVFVYAIIMEKLAGAVATISSSILAGLLFVSLMNITRIPAYPFVGVSLGLAIVFGAAIALSTVNRLNEEYKNSSKVDTFEIAEKVNKAEILKYLIITAVLLIAAVAISAFFTPYMMIVGGQIAIAGLCAIASSYFGAPLLWAVIKGKKK